MSEFQALAAAEGAPGDEPASVGLVLHVVGGQGALPVRADDLDLLDEGGVALRQAGEGDGTGMHEDGVGLPHGGEEAGGGAELGADQGRGEAERGVRVVAGEGVDLRADDAVDRGRVGGVLGMGGGHEGGGQAERG